MKKTVACILAVMLSIGCCLSSYAAESLNIDSVSLDLSYDTWFSGEDCDDSNITITADESFYRVTDSSIINRPAGAWHEGDIPNLKVELTAAPGYRFSSYAAVQDGIQISGGEPYNAQRSAQNTILKIYIHLNAVESNGWEEADDDVENPNGPGTTPKKASGTWKKDPQFGWKYINADGSQTKNGWQLINSKWYYFNMAGFMLENNWVLWKGIYYFCGPNGDMWVNRRTPDGYWVNEKGEWVKGK